MLLSLGGIGRHKPALLLKPFVTAEAPRIGYGEDSWASELWAFAAHSYVRLSTCFAEEGRRLAGGAATKCGALDRTVGPLEIQVNVKFKVCCSSVERTRTFG